MSEPKFSDSFKELSMFLLEKWKSNVSYNGHTSDLSLFSVPESPYTEAIEDNSAQDVIIVRSMNQSMFAHSEAQPKQSQQLGQGASTSEYEPLHTETAVIPNKSINNRPQSSISELLNNYKSDLPLDNKRTVSAGQRDISMRHSTTDFVPVAIED